MARWGRRGLLSRMMDRLPSGSMKRVKTVSWGNSSSNRGKAWGGKWQPKPKMRTKAMTGGSRPAWGGLRSASRMRPRAFKSSGSSGRTVVISGGDSPPVSPRSRKKRYWVLFALLVLLLGTIQSFVYIEKHLRPPLMKVAEIRIKQVATQAINKATTEEVVSNSDFEKLIDWKMNSAGKVSGFMLNYAEHTKIRAQTIDTVQSTLSDLKEIPERIPIGNALGSAIISSYGPRVPVKFEPVGAVKVDLNTRQKNAGINMILIEVYIHIVTEVAIIVPFETEPQLVETEIPISYLLVVGDVPMYYYDNKGNPLGDSAAQAPNISVPLTNGEGVSKPSDGSMIEEHLNSSSLPAPGTADSGD
ncbi:sporulation protein YunB [Paenibacillus gorillae]|uniref:sporulation protein YunB n=1 Tax=Paenibacillus gorillae TaxID=1243662 RepID=UPI0004B6B611|nr:sporulation protein YunB [Paenibacillus gorillae]